MCSIAFCCPRGKQRRDLVLNAYREALTSGHLLCTGMEGRGVLMDYGGTQFARELHASMFTGLYVTRKVFSHRT